jgi:hypothetical protein
MTQAALLIFRVWRPPYTDGTISTSREVILIRSPATAITGRQPVGISYGEMYFKSPNIFVQTCLIPYHPFSQELKGCIWKAVSELP